MPITQTITNNAQLFQDLKAMDRDNFSYNGAIALMDYLDQMSEDCGTNIEYDPIAFCCEFSEYEDLEDIQSIYPDIETIEDLYNNTMVIEFNGGLIIQNY